MKNKVGLYAQLVLYVGTLISFIVSLCQNKYFPIFYTILSLTMFVCAYNNHKIYKRKYFTIFYILMGLAFLVSAIIGFIN